jgi:hypothetical protein
MSGMVSLLGVKKQKNMGIYKGNCEKKGFRKLSHAVRLDKLL